MAWIQKYQLFLFDLDGLLVNTEEIHYHAYIIALSKQGIELDWDFNKYCSYAHYTSEGVKLRLYQEFPQLGKIETTWDAIYAAKKATMIELLKTGAVRTMPGVFDFLTLLQKASISRCVVTNSSQALVEIIREKNPILDTIPHWLTREHYSKPKPDPESYKQAIRTLAHLDHRVIGFEDTPRGIEALSKTRAAPFLITSTPYAEIPSLISQGVQHFTSFEALL